MICCGDTRGAANNGPADMSDPNTSKVVDAIFEAVDLNNDGYIDSDEADILCKSIFSASKITLNLKNYKTLLHQIDEVEPFGRIDKDEFNKFFTEQILTNESSVYDMSQSGLQNILTNVAVSKAQHKSYIIPCEQADVNRWYSKKKELGKGKYAAVELWAPNLATLTQELAENTPNQVAVKMFAKAKRSKKEVYDVIDEFLMMRHTIRRTGAHPNVVRMFQMMETPSSLYMMIEFVPGGDLYQLVKKKCLKESDGVHVSCQILQGLQYIHANDIIHLDLKPENVMVDQIVRPPYQVKIADFGLSEVMVDRSDGHDRFPGSPLYCSPEIFAKKRNYDEKTDIWAVGVMFHEMICGATPFRGVRKIQELGKMVREFQGFQIAGDKIAPVGGKRSTGDNIIKDWDRHDISLPSRKTLARLMQPNATNRPSATLILRDECYRNQTRTVIQTTDYTTEDWMHFKKILNKMQFELRTLTITGADLSTPSSNNSNSGRATVSRNSASTAELRQESNCGGDCSIM